MIRPAVEAREITIDLPGYLVESLGSGAEILAHHLTVLAESGNSDPASHPPPIPVLCRICERQIPPWWFEKHTELCLQEHQAEMDVQISQENLSDHRNAIVKVLDALEARSGRPTSGEVATPPLPAAEYKGLPIGPSPSSSTGPSSGTASPSLSTHPSRESSATGLGHARARSFAVRRPLTRIVELLCDLCDTAIEINTPAIREAPSQDGDQFRTQSPQSESRIAQVLQWQSPSTNTLDQEQGLAALCSDTENLARAKVDAVDRHRRIIEYSERIRVEFANIVQDCIEEALRKASRMANGEMSDSTLEEEEEEEEEELEGDEEQRPEGVETQELEQQSEESQAGREPDSDTFFTGSFDGPTALAAALRKASDPALSRFDRRSSSAAISTRSSSPKESITPRSHKGAISILGQPHHYKRSSMAFESDANDSDSSVPSSMISGFRRTESPKPEQNLSRAASSRERHRRSIALSGTASPQRQASPGRANAPPSPLRISKPRYPHTQDGSIMPSPITSPLLSAGDLSSPAAQGHHHRRQSSATSSDWTRFPPPSPHVASSHPPARAVQTSIKDFEIIKPISKGAFGSVYLSKKKSTGDYYAIKTLKKADMVAKNQVTNVKAERAIMMWQGESDFVAKLYWTFSSKDYLYLVMEYLNGGDCAALIKVLGGLPEDWAKKYLAEVVLGVEHLHERNIVHRDLKPDNLLIDQKGHLKLTDFGLSRMGLIGRQKRALNSGSESAPDLLKQGPFVRAVSVGSSRSTSFDFHGHHSPGSTPQMTPDLAGSLSQPSYFNLNRETSLSREPSRRRSGHRSDSGGSDSLHAMFNTFSLAEPTSAPPSRQGPIEEETRNGSPDLPTLLQTVSNSSAAAAQHHTPPQSSMMPPPMALFDPEDSNRRFVGTPDYLAPETINGVGQDETSDWWSLGCILFEFLYGYPPFHADTPDQVFENILQRNIHWPNDEDCPVSPEVKDLMNKLMTTDPRQRLGSNIDEKYASGGEEIRSHPWFADIDWETLLESEAQFVPAVENPEDTEYFDARGATLQSFAEELEEQTSPPIVTPGADYPDRPHDALSRVRNQVNSQKRGLMPLHIPPHVRDGRSRRLSEPVSGDDFGSFQFKNLPVLEKANKDVIQKLRAEAMQAQSKNNPVTASPSGSSPAPSLENSPILPMPLKRQLSTKGNNRSASPSTLSQSNSSPGRISQPSSPLLVSFTAGRNDQPRKTSSNSSTLSHQSSGSLQPGSFFDVPRLSTSLKNSSTASSPIKAMKPPPPLPLSPSKGGPSSRARSQTVGSQEGEPQIKDIISSKRRSGIFDMSPSSSDNEDAKANALLRVQRRRQSSRRMSQLAFGDGPVFRPLDVLICEDHPVSRMVMEKLLEKLRCRTITVGNGPEAMRFAMSEVKFDIILMEFRLPQINGADVARMIRDTKNANSQTPIVAVTGYLKELQAPHHFDALIEKPPTTSKLTEVMCRLCQWKAPTSSQSIAFSQTMMQPSSLRQESTRLDDSPSSVSSGFAQMPGSNFRGSSREDSISSSLWGDADSVTADEIPIFVSRQATEEWPSDKQGLGITDDPTVQVDPKDPVIPHLLTQSSAPSAPLNSTKAVSFSSPMNHPPSLDRNRMTEKILAKRESLEKKLHESADSGDDEDELLGDVQVRAKSPNRQKGQAKGSKLGTEMMRTNSRGSVISASEINAVSSPVEGKHVGEQDLADHPLIEEMGDLSITSNKLVGGLTPPEIFPKVVGNGETVDLDATPRAPHSASPPQEPSDIPTPKAEIKDFAGGMI